MINFEKRVREINYKYSSLSGNFVSKKNDNKLIQFESSLERDYVYLLEFNPEVYCYLEQPLKINYVNSQNKRKTYTPDFLVRYRDPLIKDELIEIKYNSDLVANYFLLKPKFQAAEEFCEKNCLTFSILTEKDIREKKPDYLKNIIFLFRYRVILQDSKNENLNEEDVFLIIKTLRKLKVCSIQDLLNKLSKEAKRKAELLFYIWFLIAKKYIECDLEVKLSMNSIIWVS